MGWSSNDNHTHKVKLLNYQQTIHVRGTYSKGGGSMGTGLHPPLKANMHYHNSQVQRWVEMGLEMGVV